MIFFDLVNILLDLSDHEVAPVMLAQVVVETVNEAFEVFFEGLILELFNVVITQINT